MPILYKDTCEHCATCVNCGRKEKQCILICDECRSDVEELFRYSKDQLLCEDCLLDKFERIDTDYYNGGM